MCNFLDSSIDENTVAQITVDCGTDPTESGWHRVKLSLCSVAGQLRSLKLTATLRHSESPSLDRISPNSSVPIHMHVSDESLTMTNSETLKDYYCNENPMFIFSNTPNPQLLRVCAYSIECDSFIAHKS